MKTKMKQLAAGTFMAFIFLVGNANAKGTETIASDHESIESSLQIEKWMTDEFLWNSNFVSLSDFTHETEKTIEIENWMTGYEIWTPVTGFIEETETGMELEEWMTSDVTWTVITTDCETELEIEKWMTESNF